MLSSITGKKFTMPSLGGFMPKMPMGFQEGGYTGDFSGGRLAVLHKKELVLNEEDTSNILNAVQMMRDVMKEIPSPSFPRAHSEVLAGIGSTSTTTTGDNVYNLNLSFQNGTRQDAKYVSSEVIRAIKKIGG